MSWNAQQALSLLEELSNAKGPSGFEDETAAVAHRWCAPFATTRENSLRNVYITPKANQGQGLRIMLDAHSDEVGMMVKSIRPNGVLTFVTLGGFTPHSLVGQKVWVHNALGEWIQGVVAAKPPHFMSAAERASGQTGELVIDIGATSDRQAQETFHVRIGEPCVPAVKMEYDSEHDLAFGKAFDCRIGCAAMMLALRELAETGCPLEPVGTLSSQEEVGERGAVASVRAVKPAVAIVFEGAPADDTFTPSCDIQTALGKGPMLRFMDCDMISNPRFTRFALDVAQKHGIPVQTSVREGGGTNGSVIHLAEDGIPCIVVGIPVRYIHAPCGISTLADLKAAVDLAVAVSKELTEEVVASF